MLKFMINPSKTIPLQRRNTRSGRGQRTLDIGLANDDIWWRSVHYAGHFSSIFSEKGVKLPSVYAQFARTFAFVFARSARDSLPDPFVTLIFPNLNLVNDRCLTLSSPLTGLSLLAEITLCTASR